MKNIKRAYFIWYTLLTYGLDEILPKRFAPWYLKLFRKLFFFIQNKNKNLSHSARVRLVMQELGPVYIKFGQLLSTRRDLLPVVWANELSMLQDRVAPFAKELAIDAIEYELKHPIKDIFIDFDPVPFASASIAQVHTAKLRENNKEVVLKILRPNIEKIIKSDLELMLKLSTFADKVTNKRLRLKEIVEDYKVTILGELNLKLEASNAKRLRENFLDSKSLYVPYVYEEYSHTRLMVSERIYGVPVSDMDALKAQGTNLKLLAERGVELFFTQVFRDNFFHADMHPGNIFVSFDHPEDPYYIGLDCGIMGSLSQVDIRYLAENFLAFFNRDYHKVAMLYVESGWVSPDTDICAFEQAVQQVCDPMFKKPLNEISFGLVLVELFATARKFNIIVQPQLVLLEKTLLYIEGLGRHLYPELNLWDTAKPFLENWLKEQMGVKQLYKKINQNLPFWTEKLPELPELIYENLKAGKMASSTQRQMLDLYLKQQDKLHNSNYFLFTSFALAICGTLLLTQEIHLLGSISIIAAIISWFSGWTAKTN